MTKPSQRRPDRYDQSGCMWGLISILDFRHGSRSTRKLLADKRRGVRQTFDSGDLSSNPKLSTDVEGNLLGNTDNEERFEMTAAAADAPANKPSMKTLIEEEMVSEQPTGINTEHHEDRKKNRKRNKRNSRGSLDMDLDIGQESFNSSKCPCNHTPDEGSVGKQNANDVVFEEFCSHINQRGISEVCLELKPKKSDLGMKEKLHEAIKEFISREVANEKNLVENGRVNFSKEVVDALQIPNLDEESFLKLLHDPSSFSVKSTEILNSGKDDKVKNSEELINSNNNNSKQRKFFRRHIKSQETKPPKKGHKLSESDTIVILKPGPNALKSYATEGGPDSLSDSSRSRQADRARAYLFLAEIKRRWKNAMGKEHNPDTVVKRQSSRFRGENPEKKSQSKDHFFIEKIAKPRESKVSTELETFGSSMPRVPNLYVEAKRHLSEMLSSGHEEVDSSSGANSPKTLARILALSEFNSPIPSPGRNWDRSFVTAHMRLTGHNNDQLEEISDNAEQKMVENNGNCLDPSETEPATAVTRDVEIEEEALSAARENMASNANAGNMIASDDVTREEITGTYSSLELISLPGAECDETIQSSETSSQDGVTEIPREEVTHDDQPTSSSFESPPNLCTTKTAEVSEILEDKPERPSPISVLEPLFVEEEMSPARASPRCVELPIEPREIKFEDGDNNVASPQQGNLYKNGMETEEEETLLLYVRSVLLACRLSWDELYLKSQSSDQLLEPSLYGEVDFFCNHPQYDQNLVFDCINEVLLEVIGQYFGFCPLVSFTKPVVRQIPNLKDAIHKVWERVRWHLLLPMPLPRSLDQIIRKDMAKGENWMDLRPDTESIGFEMGDDILDDILDDLIEDCVDESLQSLHGSSCAEIKGTIDISS